MKLTLKLLLFGVVSFLMIALVGCGLFKSVTKDEAKENLEKAGYEVRVVDGSEFADSEENPYPSILSSELDYYLEAKKGDDEIHLYFFVDTDIASNNYSFMNDPKLKSGQSNNVVYFGTKQAIKDAGL